MTANFPPDTSVHSYPNTDQIQDWIDGTTRPAALSTWKTMTSSWSVNMSTRPETVAEAAYDLWFDDWNQEVMIQVAFTGDKLRPRCDVNGDVINTVTFGGTGGVPARRWNLCVFDSEMIWQPATGTNFSSGSVDVMAMLTWLENHGDGKYLPANPTLTAVSFGFEICSTGSRNQIFQVNNFSFVATPAKLSGTGWGVAWVAEWEAELAALRGKREFGLAQLLPLRDTHSQARAALRQATGTLEGRKMNATPALAYYAAGLKTVTYALRFGMALEGILRNRDHYEHDAAIEYMLHLRRVSGFMTEAYADVLPSDAEMARRFWDQMHADAMNRAASDPVPTAMDLKAQTTAWMQNSALQPLAARNVVDDRRPAHAQPVPSRP